MITSFLRHIIHLFHFIEEAFLVLLMSTLILVACGQILLRYFFEVTLFWADPLIRHMVLWCGFLGALIAVRTEKHIRIDAILRLLPTRQRLYLDRISNFISACICGLLSWISVRFIMDEFNFATRTFFDLPTWKLQLIFPITFICMCIRFLIRTVLLKSKEDEA